MPTLAFEKSPLFPHFEPKTLSKNSFFITFPNLGTSSGPSKVAIFTNWKVNPNPNPNANPSFWKKVHFFHTFWPKNLVQKIFFSSLSQPWTSSGPSKVATFRNWIANPNPNPNPNANPSFWKKSTFSTLWAQNVVQKFFFHHFPNLGHHLVHRKWPFSQLE